MILRELGPGGFASSRKCWIVGPSQPTSWVALGVKARCRHQRDKDLNSSLTRINTWFYKFSGLPSCRSQLGYISDSTLVCLFQLVPCQNHQAHHGRNKFMKPQEGQLDPDKGLLLTRIQTD